MRFLIALFLLLAVAPPVAAAEKGAPVKIPLAPASAAVNTTNNLPATTPASTLQGGLMGGLMSKDGETLDITAEKSLEWHENERMYLAQGKAKAVRGGVVVEADILRAYDRKKPGSPEAAATTKLATNPTDEKDVGGGEIWKMVAEGHVHITNNGHEAFGDKAEYDIDTHKAVLTGQGLRYVTPTDVVTAKNSLQYDETTGEAIADGDATAVREGRKITADQLTAFFKKDEKGQQVTDRLEAHGKIEILSNAERVLCDDVVYYQADNRAVLTGHVNITKGTSELKGDKAEANFTTGISRLLNSGSGRVHALVIATKGEPKQSTPSAPSLLGDNKKKKKTSTLFTPAPPTAPVAPTPPLSPVHATPSDVHS